MSKEINATAKIGGAWIVDDTKMNQTYVLDNMANTLAARDYKNPQALVLIYDECQVTSPVNRQRGMGGGNAVNV